VPVFINAVGGLGSPWWRPGAMSYLVGDGPPWERAVAVAESILFLIRANLDTMTLSECDIERLTVTGGLARLDGMCWRLADLSGRPVYTGRPKWKPLFAEPPGFPLTGPDTGLCRVRWFRPAGNQGLIDRYHLFSMRLEKRY
jgi:glycerol kinase